MTYSKNVAIFTLKNDDGKFLLLKRSADDKYLPNYWAFIGGGIEIDETPEEAVMREANEEIGIKPKVDFFRDYDNLKCLQYNYHPFVFIGKLKHSLEQLKKQQMEGQDLGLFSPDEILKMKIHDGDMVIWKDIFDMEKTKYWRKIGIFTLIDKNGKILLQHRDENTPVFPNCWGFFGGGIEIDETPEEAVMREANEELGIEPKLDFFGRYKLKWRDKAIEAFLFVGKLKHSLEQLKKQQKEGNDLGLFSEEELKNIKLWREDSKMLKDIFKNEEE